MWRDRSSSTELRDSQLYITLETCHCGKLCEGRYC